MDIDIARAEKIAARNDAFRKRGFGFMMTPGVQELEDLLELLTEIRMYTDFTEDNDIHHEHDFGAILWFGKKVFWKIDYYDQELEYGLDPLDRKCRRVLTVMLAHEY